MKRPIRLAFPLPLLIGLAPPVIADPVVHFIVSNDPCLIQTCPGSQPPRPTTVQAGIRFDVFVVTVGAENQTDLTYTGPAGVTSSDAGAVLPVRLTFLQGTVEFTATLATAGNQTITVTDPARGITGSLTMTVTAPTGAPVPTLSDTMKLLLVSVLAAAGIWLVRAR